MADIVIDVRAYSKMLLHAMKYPHHSVNGVFLAEKRRNKEHGGGSVNIIDSIPLFHLCLSLTPMLEVAMMQIDQYCKDHSLVIAGYYQANEHIKDSNPDFIAYRIADKIYENFSDACLVMVDNQKMSLDCDDLAFHLYQFNDGKWRLKDKNSIHFEQGHRALSVTAALLHSKMYRKLSDFDNHLDDISLDWSNVIINEEIDRCL
ncbi:ER membrane protein complex subunit 8-like [Argiope bruennichi]|uniref:ER membrane protein complex subunit 8 like protein n=1 Tax=Argiope bruennichi TaxID=94029 RepID=A0A8T0FCD0_ARGBR|nr:ER membrane protein complex subunit 8-like [Argiope bruennichi]KAF8787089.1 ER membrane protein complex subunit 8 like protein [Argiope bruennichi]